MKIIPSKKIELSTPFSKEKVEQILIENIQPKRGISFKINHSKNQKLFNDE